MLKQYGDLISKTYFRDLLSPKKKNYLITKENTFNKELKHDKKYSQHYR